MLRSGALRSVQRQAPKALSSSTKMAASLSVVSTSAEKGLNVVVLSFWPADAQSTLNERLQLTLEVAAVI